MSKTYNIQPSLLIQMMMESEPYLVPDTAILMTSTPKTIEGCDIVGATYGSLFSGVGGMDMGFDQAGFDCVFQVEWDKYAHNILDYHWPDVPKWWDVCDVDGAIVPFCDVLIFGSPCQDLSLAGKRAGLSGDKSSMFFQATRIIKEMRNATNNIYPRFAIWENVPGALSSNGGEDFGVVLNEMADCGALVVEWAVLDAQYFGVPQRRRRVFLVAVFDPSAARRCPDPILPIKEGMRRNSKKGGGATKRSSSKTAFSFGGGFDEGALDCHDRASATPFTPSSFAQYIEGVGTLRSSGGDLGGGSETMIVAPAPDSSFTHYLIDGTRNDDVRVYSEPVQTLPARMGTGGHNVPLVSVVDNTEPVAYDEYNDSIGEVHHSLRAGTKQSTGVIDSRMVVRRLTPLECERLMGFPDNHTLHGGDGSKQADSHRYKQCGNAVATPVAKWVALKIKNILTQV